MTRLVPAAVAVFLMLTFLALNQIIISNQLPTPASSSLNLQTNTNNVSSVGAVPLDNDQRGSHSYFLSPRIFSNRSFTDAQPVRTTNQSIQDSADIATRDSTTPMRPNAQDLLGSGYLRDNEVVYTPAFGSSRKN